MKRALSHLLSAMRKRLWYVTVAAVVAIGALYFFFSGGSDTVQTLVVEPAEFVQSVSVSGTVTPARSVDMGFAQGGRVTGVYVVVGQTVGQGTLLAQTENGELYAAVEQREAAVESKKAELASLKVGTRPEEVAVAEAQVAEDESALVDALSDAYSTADDAVRNQVDQFIKNPRTAPEIIFETSDASIANAVATKRLTIEGPLALWQGAIQNAHTNLSSATEQARNNLAAVQSLLSDASAALNRGIATQSVTQATLNSYAADIATARSAIGSVLSAVNAAATKLSTDRKTLELKRAGTTAEDIAGQEAEVKAANADLQAARANLQKTLITAPFGGLITRVDAKSGSIASAGTTQVAMISSGTFQIESYVPEINISKLMVGDKGVVTLDAYGEDTLFEARIISIDPAQTVRDGVSTYRAVLQFSAADPRVRSGMTANVTIETDRRQGIIAVPQGIVIARDGKKYVRVRAGEEEREREITTGEVSSRGDIEVLSGLSTGDIVVLTPAGR